MCINQCNRSSSILELLTSSTWAFLLKRVSYGHSCLLVSILSSHLVMLVLSWFLSIPQVGDGLMVYLLKYTSIFLPHPHTKYQQVAGPPITNLCYRFSKRMAESEYRHPSPFQLGNLFVTLYYCYFSYSYSPIYLWGKDDVHKQLVSPLFLFA